MTGAGDTPRTSSAWLSASVRWPLAVFYAYGATVHVANMLGWTGIDWPRAPLKWQVLDVVYLVLDVLVVWGLLMRPRLGAVAVVIAAASQIVLYTLLRAWVLDVPAAFAPTAEETGYLNTLVAFHLATLLILGAAWFWTGSATPRSLSEKETS